jgi:hypothetical protein
MNVPQRYRLPIAVVASLAVVLVVLVVVVVADGAGPIASSSPSASASASTDPTSTPEGAVRAFFEAFANAGRSDDPTVVEPFVTRKTSSAYLSAAAFLKGQKDTGKGSVTTVQRLENVQTEASGSSATVSFDYTEGGYDIDVNSGQPLETPVVLPTTRVVAIVKQIGGHWLVDSYQTR